MASLCKKVSLLLESCRQHCYAPAPLTQISATFAPADSTGVTLLQDARAAQVLESAEPCSSTSHSTLHPLVPADSTGVSALRECAGSTSPLGEDLRSLIQFEAYETRLGSPEPVDSAFKVGLFLSLMVLNMLFVWSFTRKWCLAVHEQQRLLEAHHTGSTD